MAYSANDSINLSMYGSILPQNVMTQLPSNLTMSAQGQVDHLQGYPHSHVTTAPLHIPQIPLMTSAVGSSNYIVVPTTTDIPHTSAAGPTHNDGKTSKEEPKMKPEILKKMKKLRDERKYCDLWIDVKGVRFQAHRNILAAWSPYFDSQLISMDPMIKDLMIVNYDNYEVFADLLEFLYTGVIAPRETNFLQLLHLAVSFQIDLLKSYCEEFLRCNLHLGNFISTYFLSRKYKLDSLEKFIVSFLQMNLSDTVKQSEFMSLPASRFNAFLSSGFMMQIKPEIKLFLIISWVGYEVNERERYLVLLLGHIDWSTVATDFLLEISRTENFFTSHESSLYLLLQTLYSSGISLGPYTELFPGLRQTYNHLLNDIVNTGIILPEPDDYCPVTVTAVCTKNRCVDSAVCTDLRGVMNEDLVITPTSDIKKNYSEPLQPECSSQMYEHVQNSSQNDSVVQENTEKTADINNHDEMYVEQVSETEMMMKSNKKSSKRKGKPQRVRSPQKRKAAEDPGVAVSEDRSAFVESEVKKETGSVTRKGKKRGGRRQQAETVEVNASEVDSISKTEEDETTNQNECEAEEEEALKEEDFLNTEEDFVESEEEWQPEDQEDQKASPGVSRRSQSSRYKTLKRSSKSQRNSCHVCPYCEYMGQSMVRLENHIKRNHENNMTYCCTLCDFTTKWNKKYYEHLKDVHFPGPPFCCDGCGYTNDKLQSLMVHRAKHSDDRPHVCDKCDRRFRTRNNLLAHIKTHLGLRPFACPDCDKKFATKNTLEQHIVIHSSDRPYLCDECGFSSKYQSHLISHKRIHTGNTYPCSYPKCSYSTPKKSQLKAHMRAHLGIRQFTCLTCGKSFIEKSHLVRHERIHTTDKPYKCQYCPYSSTRKDKLREHLIKHHGPEPVNKTPRTRKTAKEKKTKEAPKNFPHYDHASYTMQPQPQVTQAETDATTAFLQDIRLQLGSNLGTLMVPVTSEQVVSSTEEIITAGIERNNIIHLSSVPPTETSESAADTEAAASSIIPEDHQSYISLGVQQGQTTQTHHQLQAVPINQQAQQGQTQDYGGLSAFMALF